MKVIPPFINQVTMISPCPYHVRTTCLIHIDSIPLMFEQTAATSGEGFTTFEQTQMVGNNNPCLAKIGGDLAYHLSQV
jgi:hypothetical protein